MCRRVKWETIWKKLFRRQYLKTKVVLLSSLLLRLPFFLQDLRIRGLQNLAIEKERSYICEPKANEHPEGKSCDVQD